MRRILRLFAGQRESLTPVDGRFRAYSVVHQHARQHGFHLGHHHSSVGLHDARDSIIEALPALLAKNRVLLHLVTTLEFLSAKEKLALNDTVTCLFAGRVIKTILNISGGLSILLSLPRERFAFRKLCVSALLCRVPLFTTRIVELLAALAVLPEKIEGYTMARSVLRVVDKRAAWGHAVCSSTLLSPTAEARSNEPPPVFAPLAQLVVDGTTELATAVVSLFTALCHSVHQNQSRQAALWLQAQIFHAIRSVVPAHLDDDAAAAAVESAPTARRRRASTAALRKGRHDEVVEKTDEGYGGSLCPPLLALLARAEASAASESWLLLKISLERFLDSWDARELAEEEQCDIEVPGSANRVDILASRISRAALLLAHADVDALLDKLGHELELASVESVDRRGGDDRQLNLDVHATLAALNRLSSSSQAREAAKNHAGSTSAQRAGVLEAMLEQRRSRPSPPPESSSSSSGAVALKDDPKYAKYFKMIRMHIPKMAVALKMSAEGLDPAVLDMNLTEPAPAARKADDAEVAIKDDPKYSKYFKMLRMHIPRPAIEAKMRAEGIDPTILDLDPEGPVPSAAAPAPATPAQPAARDPRYAKYFKMIKMHVPKMAVAARMAADGLDASVLDETPAPDGKKAPATAPPKPVEPPARCARSPRAKVRKVFLDLITDGSGTFWQQQADEEVLDKSTLGDLEVIFAMPPRKGELTKDDAKAAAAAALSDVAQSDVEAARRKKKREMRSLATEACGSKRAFELSVLCSGIKVEPDALARALRTLDPDASVLVANPIALSILYEIFARKVEPSELATLQNLVLSLGPNQSLDDVSRFFVDILASVPRPREKVLHLWLRATLAERADEVALQVDVYESALRAVRDSAELKKLLGFALALSNFLNHGTPRANVAGVKISSLLKLRETKTTKTDNYKSLLAFAVDRAGVPPLALRRGLPEDLLSAVYLNQPRPEIKRAIVELRSECEAAGKERAALAADAERDPGLAPSARVAADFAAEARETVSRLEASFASLEDGVDKTLAHFGEAPTTDVEEWIKSIDRFTAQFEAEHAELAEAATRKRKRQALEEKKKKRQDDIEKMHKVHPLVGKNRTGSTGHIDKVLADVVNGSALEDVDQGRQSNVRPVSKKVPKGTLLAHASQWAEKVRKHHASMDEGDDDDDDDYEFGE